MQLLNIFHSGGAWTIPVLMSLVTIYLFYNSYRISKSGSTQRTKEGYNPDAGNVPIYKTWSFWWGVGMLIVTVFVWIGMGQEYKGE